MVLEASAIAERERWPQLGLSVTRRSLHVLCDRFNDNNIKCLCCFICAQLRTTCSGFEKTDLTEMESDISSKHQEISYVSVPDLDAIGDFFFRYTSLNKKLLNLICTDYTHVPSQTYAEMRKHLGRELPDSPVYVCMYVW